MINHVLEAFILLLCMFVVFLTSVEDNIFEKSTLCQDARISMLNLSLVVANRGCFWMAFETFSSFQAVKLSPFHSP